jgi:hypothetical protein
VIITYDVSDVAESELGRRYMSSKVKEAQRMSLKHVERFGFPRCMYISKWIKDNCFQPAQKFGIFTLSSVYWLFPPHKNKILKVKVDALLSAGEISLEWSD